MSSSKETNYVANVPRMKRTKSSCIKETLVASVLIPWDRVIDQSSIVRHGFFHCSCGLVHCWGDARWMHRMNNSQRPSKPSTLSVPTLSTFKTCGFKAIKTMTSLGPASSCLKEWSRATGKFGFRNPDAGIVSSFMLDPCRLLRVTRWRSNQPLSHKGITEPFLTNSFSLCDPLPFRRDPSCKHVGPNEV